MLFIEEPYDPDLPATTYITPESWEEACVLATALCRTKYGKRDDLRIELQVSPNGKDGEPGIWGHLFIFDLSTPTFSSSLFPPTFEFDSNESAREHRLVEVRGVIDYAGRIDVEWRMTPDEGDFAGYELLPLTNSSSWRPAYDLANIRRI